MASSPSFLGLQVHILVSVTALISHSFEDADKVFVQTHGDMPNPRSIKRLCSPGISFCACRESCCIPLSRRHPYPQHFESPSSGLPAKMSRSRLSFYQRWS